MSVDFGRELGESEVLGRRWAVGGGRKVHPSGCGGRVGYGKASLDFWITPLVATQKRRKKSIHWTALSFPSLFALPD